MFKYKLIILAQPYCCPSCGDCSGAIGGSDSIG